MGQLIPLDKTTPPRSFLDMLNSVAAVDPLAGTGVSGFLRSALRAP